MKVILVANTDWYLYNFRLSLAHYLQQQGDEVVLVSPGGEYADCLQREGFRWQAWPVGRRTVNPGQEFGAIKRLEEIYRSEKPDLVHHFTVKPVLYGSLAARRTQVPAVVNSITGLGYVFLETRPRGALLRGVVFTLYRQAFRHPNLAVIFENASDRDIFTRLGLVRMEKTHIIQGVGVDVERFKPAQEVDGTPLIVFPSRMLLDKGLGELVEAARLMRSEIPFRIALVGEPDPGNPATVSEQDLRQWEQDGLVEWWGFQANMEDVYQNSHVVTLPSLGEGLPTVLIEAAASGRPIVTTDVPGCRDVVVDGINGILVPPKDPVALSQALMRLVSNPELRAKMGSAGRQVALQRFRTDQINRQTLDVYHSLL